MSRLDSFFKNLLGPTAAISLWILMTIASTSSYRISIDWVNTALSWLFLVLPLYAVGLLWTGSLHPVWKTVFTGLFSMTIIGSLGLAALFSGRFVLFGEMLEQPPVVVDSKNTINVDYVTNEILCGGVEKVVLHQSKEIFPGLRRIYYVGSWPCCRASVTVQDENTITLHREDHLLKYDDVIVDLKQVTSLGTD